LSCCRWHCHIGARSLLLLTYVVPPVPYVTCRC
jgi:hypothetical protein